MIYILYCITAYLVLISLILLRNRRNFIPLYPLSTYKFTEDAPKVSICIPARNEEQNIERCIISALNQEYPNLQVLVLDDESSDATPRILNTIKRKHSKADRLALLKGKPKPDGWLGKPWACQQLGEAAEGDILIFADADTWFSKNMAERIVRSMGHDIIDVLTVWPRQELVTFWEKMIIPLLYYALLSLLPVHYVYRAPRWMPRFLQSRFSTYFAAACGQFMVFKRSAYHKVGGHQSVKDKVVEDVELARLVKSVRLSIRMYYGSEAITCRMYRSEKEIRAGFRKNFLAGFGNNLFLFGMMGLIHFMVYVLPVILLLWALISGNVLLLMWSLMPLLLVFFHRVMIARWFGWNPFYGLLHFISVAWFQVLGYTVAQDLIKGNRVEWKGRTV